MKAVFIFKNLKNNIFPSEKYPSKFSDMQIHIIMKMGIN